MKTIRYMSATMPDTGGWKGRHTRAIEAALRNVHGHAGVFAGHSLAQAINAWCEYASAHKRRYESTIGEDGFLGPIWCKWGICLRGLLNGETGDLDCGTLDSIIVDNLEEMNFKEGKDW